ncbi:MAG: hypothetical protein FWC68_03205 [Oscillospiraceae bacterium]|nr:hypothetical protein [Oscillospiraceae bacterium]
MRIGIDIDGVLTNVHQFTIDYFTKYCVENNIEYTIGDCDYESATTFNVSNKTDEDFWYEHIFYYAKNQPARIFSSEVIKKLKKEGHEIYIITARWLSNKSDETGNKMRNAVENWLHNNDIKYDKLIFSKLKEYGERKIESCENTKIDLMIEDSPQNIIELSAVCPIICFDNSYNQNVEGNNIYRCYSWYDIYKKIREINI